MWPREDCLHHARLLDATMGSRSAWPLIVCMVVLNAISRVAQLVSQHREELVLGAALRVGLPMTKRHALALAALGFLTALGSAARDQGPMQQTGEKLDRTTGQDKLIGKGPLEKAGRSVDNAVKP
jgi:hypothetical protein